jgi:predicted RND superfamily exporter protein
MTYTFRRALNLIFWQNLCSASVFYSMAFSELMPIKSFGIFSGTLVLVSTVFSLTTFPALLAVHHKFMRYRACLCIKRESEYAE